MGVLIANKILVASATDQATTYSHFGYTSGGILTLGTSVTAGGTYNTDTDSIAVIARTTALATNSNAHAFVDATIFQRTTNGYAYNSFTNNVQFIGSANYDHYAAFQSNFSMKGSGTMSIYYGYYDFMSVDSGVVPDRYAFYAANPTGAGTLQRNYGLYVPTLSKGTVLNYGIYIVSNDSVFGGRIRMFTSSGAVNALTPEVAYYHTSNFKTAYTVTKLLANSSNYQIYVSQASLLSGLNIAEFVGDNGNGLGTINGSVFINGKTKFGGTSAGSYPVAWVDIAASTTATPHMRLASGVAPTTPANGDIWFDGTDIKMRIGGVTKTFTLT